MTQLSILIPARNEELLGRTIQDICENMRADTEIIVVLDGEWADPPIEDNERVTLIYHPESIGQRAATNEAARIARGKYVMKCDAHCAFGEGFDAIMINDMQPMWTMVPAMRNLHAFDWVCRACGHRCYQGPTPECCPECGKGMEKEIVWEAKTNPYTTSMRFDRNLKFQYWRDYKRRQDGDLVETMSLLGACWMLTKERYFELDICDENHGSWGQQGTEVACKTWLSGGKLVCTKKTWFAHMFRTQGGDFSFPYPLSGKQVRHAREYSQDLWRADAPSEMPKWDKAIYPLLWLVNRFAPVPDWEGELPSRSMEPTPPPGDGVLYYTCNTHAKEIEHVCRRNLSRASDGLFLGTVSREPIEFGEWNIVVDGPRGPLTMHRQILAGLEKLESRYVFLAESDVLYHPSHFDFVPPRDDTVYYNTNVWKVWDDNGHATWTDDLQQVSGICASRELLLRFYRERVAHIEANGFDKHYEPGPKTGEWKTQNWQSKFPNVDIRHSGTLTRSKRSPDEFRNPRYAKGWTEAGEVMGWGVTEGRFQDFLRDVEEGKLPRSE